MSYQIPQQLEYKEKIMFGLTFQQLAYAFIFGTISILIFRKIDNLTIAIPLIFLFSSLGIGFIFLNFSLLIKNYWGFLRFQNLKINDPKMEKFIGLKDIKDDFIITSKNKKIAILRVQPINFSIKPETEKESIIYSFQKFLNSLDFPTQILMNTEGINLEDYLKSLKERAEKSSFKELFEKYQEYLRRVIHNDKILNRVFYIVIPEQTNIDIQTEICIDRLSALNLKVQKLNNLELKKLLLSYFLGSNDQNNLVKSLSPEFIDSAQNYLKIGNKYQRVLYASGYPRNVEAGFLDKIVSSVADFNLSIHIKPYPIERMLIDLNKELQKQQADIYSMQKKGTVNPSLDIQHRDTRQTLEDLQKGKDRLFNVSLYINCKANSLKELDTITKKVESELNSIMILPKVANFRMLQGFKAVAPLGIDELNVNRNITTEALSAFFPFTSQFLQADDSGVWLGLNSNKIPIIKDIFKLPNPNGLVLAQSGGGKSYFCKLLITRYLLNGTKVMVIDPQGEYRTLVNYFGGQRIDLSKDSETMINPLDLMGHDYAEKRLALMDIMQIMLGKLSDPQKSFIDRAISEAYKKKGINDDPSTWKNNPPILEDVLKALINIEKRAIQLEKSTIRSLVNRLEMYVTGVFKFMNKPTNIDFNNRFVCFDIGNLPKQVKPVIMFLVLDYVYMKMKSDLSRKILLIDESWSLLSRTEEAGYIFEIVKTCRKFNMGLLMINQEVEGLFASPAGKSVLANSAYTLLMKQKPVVIKNICDTFNLSDSEKQHLLTCSIGEGLLIMEDDHSKIKVVASEEEHKIITTNADELNLEEKKEIKEVQVEGRNVKINVDSSKGIFKYNHLNSDERKYLSECGYKISKHKGIMSKKYETYMIRPRFNEGANHFFVIYDIKSFLEKKGINVETPTTTKPDLIFKIKDKTYAIEVESGIILEKAKKQLLKKIQLLNKNYDKWLFVVTSQKFVSKYSKLAPTTDTRYLKNRLKLFIDDK